jgi:ribosomal protein L39E
MNKNYLILFFIILQTRDNIFACKNEEPTSFISCRANFLQQSDDYILAKKIFFGALGCGLGLGFSTICYVLIKRNLINQSFKQISSMRPNFRIYFYGYDCFTDPQKMALDKKRMPILANQLRRIPQWVFTQEQKNGLTSLALSWELKEYFKEKTFIE